METNPAARLYAQVLRRTTKYKEDPVELRTGGFLKRPIESSSTDSSNDVAERAAHYFMQVYNERKKFNEDKNA